MQQLSKNSSIHWGFAFSVGFMLVALVAGLGPLLGLGIKHGFSGFDRYSLQVSLFTLLQATLSCLLSVGLGVPLARALARRQFAGRQILLLIFSLPMALPAIVVILALLSLYGTQGLFGGVISIYGLSGIVLAHVFFNLPLATRLMLVKLEAIAPDNFRLGAQLGFNGWAVFRFIEWPALMLVLPSIAALVFLLCVASFTVVLILGGGPQATTLEVAIYQSLRLDFDPARAALLSLIQLGLCLVLVAFAGRAVAQGAVSSFTAIKVRRYDGSSLGARLGDGLIILAGVLLVVPPLIMVVVSGLGEVRLTESLFRALMTSLALGLMAGGIGLTVTCLMVVRAARASAKLRTGLTMLALAPLVMPPAVIATGWFLTALNFPRFSPPPWLLVVLLNSLMAVPFVWAPLYHAVHDTFQKNDRLCASLGLRGWQRFRLIDLPSLRRPLALAFTMVFLVSLGDLSAITLFGSGGLMTLPSLILAQMGHYRMGEAAGTGLVLASLSLLGSWLAMKWSRA